MVHNARRCRKNNVAKLTRREELDNPFLEVGDAHVVPRRDDTGFVQAVLSHPESAKLFSVVARMPVEFCAYRPLSWITILPDLWSSTSSNSPM